MARETATVNEWDLDSFNYAYDSGNPTMCRVSENGLFTITVIFDDGDKYIGLELVELHADEEGKPSAEDSEPTYTQRTVAEWKHSNIRGELASLLAAETTISIDGALEAFECLWALMK